MNHTPWTAPTSDSAPQPNATRGTDTQTQDATDTTHQKATAKTPASDFPVGVQTIPLHTSTQSSGQRDEIRYEILRHLGTLSTNARGWSKEVNVVSWNDRPARLDIREWNSDHQKMSRGVNFGQHEATELKRILATYDPGEYQMPEN